MAKQTRAAKPGTITLEITRESIAAAVAKDSHACVIADAINRQIPGARAEVDLQSITLTMREKGYRYTWLTPDAAQDLLIAFDQGHEVEPATITLTGYRLIRARKLRGAGDPRKGSVVSSDGKSSGGVPKVAQVAGTSRPVGTAATAPPEGVLSNRKGRVRRYGARLAKP